MDLRVFDVTLV